jgi:hypothetical protein
MKGVIRSCYPWPNRIDVYSPLPLEALTQCDQELGAMTAFAWIHTPPDLLSNPFWATQFGNDVIMLRRYILTRFIQRRFNKGFSSEYDLWRKRRGPKRDVEKVEKSSFKAQIEAEVTLWFAVRRILLELQSRNGLYAECARSPMIALYDLITEPGGLLMPYLGYIPEGEPDGAVAVIRSIQQQNFKLELMQQSENPFVQDETPFSYWFTKKAIKLAGASDEGRKDWGDVVKARMKLATVMRTGAMRSFSPGDIIKPERRTRRNK